MLKLEFDDNWVNRRAGSIKLPNDSAVKDPDKLESLSGPVITYNLYERKEAK